MRYAVALSEHPDPGVAIGEVVGQVLDRTGANPDLAILFMTGHHVNSARRAGLAIRATLGAQTLVGSTAVSVLAHRQEIEERPAIVLWAGHTGPCRPLRLTSKSAQVADLESGTSLLVLADPFSYDPSLLFSRVPAKVAVVGGFASASSQPGGDRLLLDDGTYVDGAVGVVLPPDIGAQPLVSQGCRPVGEPFTVTDSKENLLIGLGGLPAVDRIRDLISTADESTRTLISRGLHVGVVVNEQRETFELGDFLIRPVLRVDPTAGWVAVGDQVAIGTTVQFQVRDAATASAELRALVRPLQADTALVFTCNGRGTSLFGQPGHDAERISDGLTTTAIAGMFCAGEIGPIGGRPFLHGFTASSLLLGTNSVT